MAEKGYETRQIGLSMIVPHMGKKVAQKTKQTAAEKAKQNLRSVFLRRKAAQAKAKAKGKAKAKAKAKASPENSVELEEVAEPEEQWEDSQGNTIFLHPPLEPPENPS